MSKYIISLVLTEIIECAVVGFQSRNLSWTRYIFLVNLLTNPIANVLVNGLGPLFETTGRNVLILSVEAAVVLSEAVLIFAYRKRPRNGSKALTRSKCFLYSLNLNAVSYILGVFFQGFSRTQ